MYPKIHIFFGISSFLFLLIFASEKIGVINALFFSLSSIFIDIDHYIYYVLKKRNFNPRKAHDWFIERIRKLGNLNLRERKEYKRIFLIFHGVEAWIVMAILSFYFSFIGFILAGFLFHMLFDWADIWDKNGGLDVFFGRFSWIYMLVKDRDKKEFLF